MKIKRPGSRSFTLVEILVVVSIIGLLAGLSIPAVGGALRSARKAKATAMMHQIRTALASFQAEYGYFPTNGFTSGIGNTGPTLALILTADTNSASSVAANPRRIPFLEVPADFTFGGSANLSNRGIVTPSGLYKSGQSNFSVAVDHDYNGAVATNTTGQQNIRTTVAVWMVDPADARKVIGTWK